MVANNLYFTLADAVAQLVEKRGVRVQWTRGQRWIGLETVTALQHVEKLDPNAIANLTASPAVHRRALSAVSSNGGGSDAAASATPPASPRPDENLLDPTPPESLGRPSAESGERRLVSVTFKVIMDTEYDESALELCILGDGRLGNWSSASCLVLDMQTQTNAAGEEDTIWTASLELEEMMTLQYKYVLRKKQSRRIHLWEALAENHQVTPVGDKMVIEQCAFPVEDDPADKECGRSYIAASRRIDSGWLDSDFQVQIKFGTWEGQPAVQTEGEVLPTKKVDSQHEIPAGVIATPPTSREKPKRRAKGARPGSSDDAVPSKSPVKARFHAGGRYGFMVDVLVPKPTIEVTRLRHEPSMALVTGPTLTSLAFVIDVYDEKPDPPADGGDDAQPVVPKHLGRVHITPQDLEDHISRGSSLYDMPLQRPIVQLNGRMSGILNFEMLIVNPFVHPKNNLCYTLRSVWAAGRVLDIGHRGFGHSAPGVEMSGAVQENTVLSFITAAKHGGDFVEFDVHLTKDDVPIIYHNFALDILVGSQTVKLPINQLTLEEIRSLFTKSGTVDEDDEDVDGGVHGVVVQPLSPAKEAEETPGADDASYPRLGMPLVKQTPPSGMDYSDPDRPRSVRRDAEVEANVGHAAPRGSHKVRKTRSAEAVPTKKKGKQKFQALIADGIATLEEVMREVPSHLGFNIEIKYPMFYEMIRDPYTFYPKNHFLNVILKCVFDNARSRPIIFSSFEPDIVAMVAQKQTRYPVFFLTTAGQAENARDVRAISLEHAVRWAILHPIRGVVSEAQAILDDISYVAEVKRHELLYVFARATARLASPATVRTDTRRPASTASCPTVRPTSCRTTCASRRMPASTRSSPTSSNSLHRPSARSSRPEQCLTGCGRITCVTDDATWHFLPTCQKCPTSAKSLPPSRPLSPTRAIPRPCTRCRTRRRTRRSSCRSPTTTSTRYIPQSVLPLRTNRHADACRALCLASPLRRTCAPLRPAASRGRRDQVRQGRDERCGEAGGACVRSAGGQLWL